MARDTNHKLLPETDHDGMSRRLAVLASKQALRATLEASLKAEFLSDQPAPLESLPTYATWASLNRGSQDRMWALLADQIDKDLHRITSVAESKDTRQTGSLSLNKNAPPGYLHNATIHGQPGGYLLDRSTRDLAAGVLYEAGGNLYALGAGIGKKDSKAQRLIRYFTEEFARAKPRRILEMGCSAGGQSADYPAAFPGARCDAIDASAGMLRYAHARSQLLGANVHFTQADAADTPFADESYDLIVSHNMFHEVSAEHMPAIINECFRLLAPGGVVIHQDVPIQLDRLDDWMRAVSAWQKDNNNEPFWMDFAQADLPELLKQAGFDPANIKAEYLTAVDGPIPWYVVSAIKPTD